MPAPPRTLLRCQSCSRGVYRPEAHVAPPAGGSQSTRHAIQEVSFTQIRSLRTLVLVGSLLLFLEMTVTRLL